MNNITQQFESQKMCFLINILVLYLFNNICTCTVGLQTAVDQSQRLMKQMQRSMEQMQTSMEQMQRSNEQMQRSMKEIKLENRRFVNIGSEMDQEIEG